MRTLFAYVSPNLLMRICRNYTSEAVLQKDVMPLPPRKARAAGYTTTPFVDFCRVLARGGNGGDGALSFLASWCKPFDGPDGGDGGHGGHVIFEADSAIRSFNHMSKISEQVIKLKGQHGQPGRDKNCHGACGKPLFVKVPVGTVFRRVDTDEVVCELLQPDAIFIAARGGGGGHGNRFYLSNEHRAPTYAEKGAAGEANVYDLEMKIMAQIGLVGFTNAGKSSLLRAVSRARPKVSVCPFTTLKPHIGIVEYEDYVQMAIADVPGLEPGGTPKIEGLDADFLRHIDRCALLAYVIDLSLYEEPWEQIELLKIELEKFRSGLSDRTRFVLANKIDVDGTTERCEELKRRSTLPVFPISAKFHQGIVEFLVYARKICDAENAFVLNFDKP